MRGGILLSDQGQLSAVKQLALALPYGEMKKNINKMKKVRFQEKKCVVAGMIQL